MSLLVKLTAAALITLAVGVPILETWEALFLAATVMTLVFGTRRPGLWRLGAAAGAVLVIIGLKAVLPHANIAEGHNAFLVIGDGEPLQQGLPPEVFANWKAQFDALYPPDTEPYQPRSEWRKHGVPKSLFTQSADAIWRSAKYTRQVDRIEFRSLGEFRSGFANELQYPWWVGELRRESMPFHVMYELTPASVGSSLAWKGQVFWERKDGTFEEIVHQEVASREIAKEDAGKRIYAAFFSTPGMLLKREGELHFKLEPSLTLRLAGWAEALLTVVGGISVVMLIVIPRWGNSVRALSIFAAGYAVMASFMWAGYGKYLGKTYPPHGGGDDGLVHDGWGRVMAMLAGQGEVIEALRGTEDIYWFTPGTRYVRMAEKLIFGDTNHLYALLVSCVPIAIFYLIRHFIGTRRAGLLTAVVILMPVGNLSYLQYVANAKLGYGEALAVGLFLFGSVLLLRTQPAWGGTETRRPLVFIAGVALSASMFIRPNFAIAVVWLGAAYAWYSWTRRETWAIAALALGLGLALWMPFHNWYYGGEFYLVSKSGATISVTLGPGDYASALGDLLAGRLDRSAIEKTSAQLRGWLWAPPGFAAPGLLLHRRLVPAAWLAHIVNLFALMIACWVAVRWVASGCTKGTGLAVVAVAAICAHIPMLFVFGTHYRYAMLGWDLSLIVLIVWLAALFTPASTAVRDFQQV